MGPRQERDEFFILLGRAMPHDSLPTVHCAGLALIRAASAHLRACEGMCSLRPPNDDYGDEATGRLGYWERRCEAAEKAAEHACPEDWRIEHQRDPRGGTLWLQAVGMMDAAGWKRIYPPATGYPASVFA